MSNFTVGLIKIPVTNFEAATHYYREVIGLEEEFAVEAYGWAQYKTSNLPLCLYVVGKGGGDGKPGEEVGFHLKVDDLDWMYSEISARGGLFASEIVASADGGKFVVLRDPDGNTFKVTQTVQ
ncbi:MAG: VOC family protein [Chloroflexota bacterium]